MPSRRWPNCRQRQLVISSAADGGRLVESQRRRYRQRSVAGHPTAAVPALRHHQSSTAWASVSRSPRPSSRRMAGGCGPNPIRAAARFSTSRCSRGARGYSRCLQGESRSCHRRRRGGAGIRSSFLLRRGRFRCRDLSNRRADFWNCRPGDCRSAASITDVRMPGMSGMDLAAAAAQNGRARCR